MDVAVGCILGEPEVGKIMTLPKDAFCPEQMKPLVEKGWATNRHRDQSDGHDRTTAADKLRTALLALACGDPDAINEGLAMIVETELDLRGNCARPTDCIKETILALKRQVDGGTSDAKHKLVQIGALTGLGWAIEIIDTATFERLIGCRAN
jgi:hypothetical protein